MPQLLPALAAGLVAAAGQAINVALQPRLPRQKTFQQSSKVDLASIVRDNTAPSRVIYGTMRTSGVLAYAAVCNERGEPTTRDPTGTVEGDSSIGNFLHMCLLMAEGPVDSIQDFQLNDISYDDPDPAVRAANLALYRDHAHFFPFVGDEVSNRTIPSFATIMGAVPPIEWTTPSPDRLDALRTFSGIAGFWAVLKYDKSVFPSSAPNLRATCRGRRLWDPRRDSAYTAYGATAPFTHDYNDASTRRWSDNWALCILDFLHNDVFGYRIPLDQIDMEYLIAAANDADALVETPVLETDPDADTWVSKRGYVKDGVPNANGHAYLKQRRYTINGEFDTSELSDSVLLDMLEAGAGNLIYVKGKYRLLAGVARAPIGTLTADHLRDSIKVATSNGRKGTCNTVRGTYLSQLPIPLGKDWQTDAFPAVTMEAYKAEDRGFELADTLDLRFCGDVYQAQRLAWIHLRQKRQDIFAVFPANLIGLKYVTWDTLYLKHDVLGWSALNSGAGKRFRVEQWGVQSNNGPDLSLSEYDDSIYNTSINDLTVPDPAPNSTLPSGFTANPVRNLMAVATVTKQAGVTTPQVDVAFDPPVSTLVQYYVIRWRRSDDTATQEIRQTDTACVLTGVRPGTWVVSVFVVTQHGVWSAGKSATLNIDYRVLPPPNVSALSVDVTDAGTRVFEWTILDPPVDLDRFELRYLQGSYGADPATEWSAATALTSVHGRYATRTETTAPAAPGTYTVYIKAVDAGGLESDMPAIVTVIVPQSQSPGVLYVKEMSAHGWPGTVIQGTHNGLNEIEATDRTTTWDTLPATWDDWTSWVLVPAPIIYRDEIIDLGAEYLFTPIVAPQVAGSAHAQMRVWVEGVWGPWTPVVSAQAQRLQFQITVQPTATDALPILRRCRVAIQEVPLSEEIDDLDTSRLWSAPSPLTSGADSRYDEAPYVTLALTENVRGRWATGDHYLSHIDGDNGGYAALEAAKRPCLRLGNPSLTVTIPDATQLRLTSQWSIEIAIAPQSYSDTARYLIDKGGDYAVRYSAGIVDLYAVGYAGDDPQPHSTITIPDDGCWHSASWCYDGATLYRCLDGRLVGSAAVSTVLATSTTAITVGQASGGGSVMDAYAAELRIWNRPLSLAEVSEGHAGNWSGTEEGLVGYWPLYDSSGTQASDLSPYANHGTASGAGGWSLYATRLGDPLDLSVIASHQGAALTWDATTPAGSSIAVAYTVDGGTTWLAATSGAMLTGLHLGADLTGISLQTRVTLASTDTSAVPRIESLMTSITSRNEKGAFTVAATRQYAGIDTAVITAIQQVANLTARTVARNMLGARFLLSDRLQSPADAVVDILIRGRRLIT